MGGEREKKKYSFNSLFFWEGGLGWGMRGKTRRQQAARCISVLQLKRRAAMRPKSGPEVYSASTLASEMKLEQS